MSHEAVPHETWTCLCLIRPGFPALFVLFELTLSSIGCARHGSIKLAPALAGTTVDISACPMLRGGASENWTCCFVFLFAVCQRSISCRFQSIFQRLNSCSLVGLSSVASRKRVQRYGLLWNWQAIWQENFKKVRFLCAFRLFRTVLFGYCI